MDLDDLIKELPPPPNRVGKSPGDREHHFYEGAVASAYAMHLFRTQPVTQVELYPDGEHGKRFDFKSWFQRRGFEMVSSTGTTAYGGVYTHHDGKTVVINPKSGLSDIVARIGNVTLSAECKGGIINTKHSGQISRLYRGLCEAVGLLMATPSRGRQVAVVPYTESTLRLATRLSPRCKEAGIELALVKSRGEVIDI